MDRKYALYKENAGLPLYIKEETDDGIRVTPMLSNAKLYGAVPEWADKRGWKAIPLRRAGK